MLYQTLVPLLLASSASALQVPSNVRTFYNQLKAKGTCTNKLATGFFDSKFDDGSKLNSPPCRSQADNVRNIVLR
jgi:hypothetical protein